MEIMDFVLKGSRKVIEKISHKSKSDGLSYAHADYIEQSASDLIKEKLSGTKPCMIARFGTGELGITNAYLDDKLGYSKYLKYVLGEIDFYSINEQGLKSAAYNAGIFPATGTILAKFAEQMLADMTEVDILGSWQTRELRFDSFISQATKVRLPDIEPYYHKNPWTSSLEGKTVLVIHPFTDSIKMQYEHRKMLFKNQAMLPEFNLKTIKAVQTIAGEKSEFKNWFEALDYMKDKINKTTFDIAIIGCGAYGFPLAAHVKRVGKKSVHMGGATQLLFGIKGSRWLDHGVISKLFNEHWVFPSQKETPQSYKNIEAGCYW